jgi:chitinase
MFTRINRGSRPQGPSSTKLPVRGLLAVLVVATTTLSAPSSAHAANSAEAQAALESLTQTVGTLTQSIEASTAQPPVVAYFDTTNGTSAIRRVPWKAITHLNIAFAGISPEGTCAWMDPSGADRLDPKSPVPAAIVALRAARDKYNPRVKLILSVGGWTMSTRFSVATRTPEGTQKLAQSCVEMVQAQGLDGLDYDWEYPTKVGAKNCPSTMAAGDCQSADDPAQLTALLAASRAKLSPEMPLSVAVFVTPGRNGIPYDVRGMDAQLSFWNIMAYDMAAPNWSTGTAFHAPLRASVQSLQTFADAGATPSKLNLGVPLYGYVWKNVPTAGLDVAATGNKKNGRQYTTASLLRRYISDPGCKAYRDRDGTYYYCSTGRQAGDWAAVDTAEVLFNKGAAVRAHAFGGVMLWAVQGDTEMGDLTFSLAAGLNSK